MGRKSPDINFRHPRKLWVCYMLNNNLEQQAQAIFANEFLSLDTLPEGWKQASLIDIADYLNGLAMQKYRPTADESGIPVLKSRNFVKGVVMIIASYALQVLNPIISFTMAMSFFLGRVAYWLTFGVAVSAV